MNKISVNQEVIVVPFFRSSHFQPEADAPPAQKNTPPIPVTLFIVCQTPWLSFTT